MHCGHPVIVTTPVDDHRLARVAAAAPQTLAEKVRAAANQARGAVEIRDGILSAVHYFVAEAPRYDDITLMILSRAWGGRTQIAHMFMEGCRWGFKAFEGWVGVWVG
jgi:hypothetical protein